MIWYKIQKKVCKGNYNVPAGKFYVLLRLSADDESKLLSQYLLFPVRSAIFFYDCGVVPYFHF
jgi:hypothetical protein